MSEKGVSATADKVEALKGYPKPTNARRKSIYRPSLVLPEVSAYLRRNGEASDRTDAEKPVHLGPESAENVWHSQT